MWQTKYASPIPKNLGLGLNFRPCSEGYFPVVCDTKYVLPIFSDLKSHRVFGKSFSGMLCYAYTSICPL